MDNNFEWCYFVGNANQPDLDGLPTDTCLHNRRQVYIDNPPKMTYRILKSIIEALKEEGHFQFPEAEIRVGETL